MQDDGYLDPHDGAPVPPRRPLSLTIAAWLLIAPSVALVVLTVLSMALAIVGFTTIFAGAGAGGRGSFIAIPFMLLSLVVSLLPPVGLALLGVALLRVRPWAFGVTLGVCGLILLLVLGPLLGGSRVNPLQVAAAAVAPATAIVLLLLPPSRDAFAEAREQQML